MAAENQEKDLKAGFRQRLSSKASNPKGSGKNLALRQVFGFKGISLWERGFSQRRERDAYGSFSRIRRVPDQRGPRSYLKMLLQHHLRQARNALVFRLVDGFHF